MKIDTKDEIVLAVLKKMDQRSLVGQEKYGATMMEEIVGQEKDLNRFLIDEIEEAMIKRSEPVKPCNAHAFEEDEERMKVVAQNGNTGEHYSKPHRMYPGDIIVGGK